MLRRAAACAVRPANGAVALASQRRGCVDKWYGHLLDVAPIYDWSDEDPHDGHHGRKRTPVEVSHELKALPKVEFCTTWEVDNLERPRYWHDDKNPPIYDFWRPSKLELRLDREVDANLVARAQREIPAGASEEEKDRMMNDIHEEELVTKDDRLQRAKKVNYFAHANMMDILPDPLREKVRLDIYEDLHLHDRQEIRGILREWVPMKYRLEPAPDGRKMAIVSEKHRQQFLDTVERVRAQFVSEASGDQGKQDALAEITGFYARQFNPYPHITADAIKKCTDVATLQQWARDLFYYNGDALMFACWKRAGELNKDNAAVTFATTIESEYNDQVIDFEEEEREFYELFQKSIPLTEREFLVKQMAENPVLEETLKHSTDIHILEEIESFYNEHIDAEKDVVDALIAGGDDGPGIVKALTAIEGKSNAHFIGVRKYKTIAGELLILSDKHPAEYAAFRQKVQAMGNHYAQPDAPFRARVILGLRLFDALLAAEPHMPEEETPVGYEYPAGK
eukprot:TRINITY_DN161_c0_g1_i2.p2 TRINITY_DN161_c0_g1~~TRINITY_DN161_c0_g1_i2.p2  ORF type:complete len:510 (+),score=218.01 TRINITY_DN161_c0_g1_i2:121-1650(+)